MQNVIPLPVGDQAVPSPSLPMENGHKTDLNETKLPILPGLIGAAAAMFSALAMCKILFSVKRKPLPTYHLTPEQRDLLKKVIARGEQKSWDFSYDEDFIFRLLPELKAMAR